MRNEEQIVIKKDNVDVFASSISNEKVEDDINKLAAFLYHLYRGKQG